MAVSIKGNLHTGEGRGAVQGWRARQDEVPDCDPACLELACKAHPLPDTQKVHRKY